MKFNQEKVDKIGNAIADVLKENDAFDDNGLVAVWSTAFGFLKAVTVADENGKKKERMKKMMNDMLNEFMRNQGEE